ncbi:cytochrome c biogenesis CcdA family protein [Chromobacterium paludis]|uniref:Cytochrome c biogenesis protein CcdA n=1 Tax=Chromobacterium paludis TaxID=2605945 RepID=A0A5C1DJM7_9NEIS|nr:cytochrome c biogenesis protein CcdA [Chromobacterium paludis]QEL55938.1 cytochrome c biogenesis protein CcdA [Chromobacterium paludis]
MSFGLATYGLGLLAGLLSTLSPCVLPLLPILIGSALQAHARAPLALAAGLALSYAAAGTLLARGAAMLGLDPGLFRQGGAVMLGLLGVVLLSSTLQQRFAARASRLSDWGHALLAGVRPDGLLGQFAIGLLLGLVWSPCVGPTLGGAVVLASQGSQLAQTALLMGLFGVGAALPIVGLAYLSRGAMARTKSRLQRAGKMGKALFGLILLLVSLAMLSGADRALEGWLLDHSPDWLTALTTRF